MADKKISEMATASVVDNDDNLELSHSVNGAFTSVKASILAIATKMLTAINFTSALETTNKTVIGAINEVAQGGGGGGASELDDLDDVEITNPTAGQALVYDATNEVWKNGAGGGGTTVIANPTGTPTDDLNSIQIGSDIYRIVGGGSGGGGTAKALVMKTMTWTGSGQSSKSITFDEKPLAIFNIWGKGEGTNVYCLNSPFVYGETNYFISSFSGGMLIPSVTYSNDGLTMTMSGVDPGYAFNCANAPYTMWYIVEEEVGSSADWTDITGTLVAGQTEITLYGDVDSDSSIDVYTDKFGVNPTNIELGEGGFRLLQNLVSQESELDCTCTASSNFQANPPWSAFSNASNAGWVASGNGNPTWWKVDFGEEVGLKKVEYDSADSNRKQTLSGIQYSDDGTTWNDCTLSSNEYGEAILETRVVARYFKIYWTESYGFSTYPMLTALAMYDYSSTEITLTFPVQSENLNVKVRVS